MNDEQVNAAMDEAREAVSRNDFGHAITTLEALCRTRPDTVAETLLAECRYRFHADAEAGDYAEAMQASAGFPPDVADDVYTDVAGVPEIPVDDLNLASLTAGIRQHGALLVRGFMSDERAATMAQGIEQAFRDGEIWKADGTVSPWYSRLPFTKVEGKLGPNVRDWIEMGGGVLAGDSPRNLRALLDSYEDAGIIDLMKGYFGERPVMSFSKTTLRCVPADIKLTDWHQDGAFMGTDIRSMNVWVSLSHCGSEASGLDILPKRVEQILPTGTDGAYFHWSVGQGVVDEAAQDTGGTATPQFGPGDALIFDHYFVHRTGIPANIARDRYAIESWFFPPSSYPGNEVPLQI